MAVPSEIHGQKYISLGTFRKSGEAINTPVWFGEENDRLYVMTSSRLGKVKRLRNNPNVKVAACTIRGKITGPEFAGVARTLPAEEHRRARKTINRKYWMAAVPFVWWRTDTYYEIEVLAP
jgi:PPOX class probable F420-dependent enzyme